MIHPTRTNLLMLKEKAGSVLNSAGILRARREALIREFLATVYPFIRTRDEIRQTYGKAIDEMRLSLGHEGKSYVESLCMAAKRDIGVEIAEKRLWGLKYRDIKINEPAVRRPDERGYDYASVSPHVEEAIYGFEKVMESMLEIAGFESRLKRLGAEILKTTRKIKALEERVLPGLRRQIKSISQHIGEREREAHYRLKIFKNRQKGLS